MGELRDKMDRDMLLKNLSDQTRKTYLAWAKYGTRLGNISNMICMH